MATHYIENASSGSQYYFNTNSASTTSQSHRTYTSPVTSTFNSSGYATYPANISGSHSPIQQIRLDDSHQMPQQYQSVAGFNKSVTQQYYQSPQSPTNYSRATVRAVNSQDQYHLQRSPQPTQVSPQHHHFQFDSRQQPGHASGPAVVYQTPGAAQYTHHNVDLWTENPSQGQDHYVQAQRVTVRSVSTGSPQQSHSVSPQRHQDHLQQYYSQLTPEQHQQLLRQQQTQRQQEQNSYYDQQQHRGGITQQTSPLSIQRQEPYRSTASFSGGQPNQQGHGQMAVQRVQQEEQQSHPVGIRTLMNKFAPPKSVQPSHPRSKSSSSRQYSSSNYTSNSAPRQTTTTRTSSTSHSVTYSALPKPHEPPVNSVEYYQMQMQQQGGNPFTNIQQAAAPAHIQHTPTGFGALRDRFKTGSLSEDFSRTQVTHHQQQQQQQQHSNTGGNTLSSLRNQYMNRAKELTQNELPEQPVHNISRTIIGEDIPQQKQQKQQQTPVKQQEQPQKQNENVAEQAQSFAVASPVNDDTTTAEAAKAESQ